MPELTIASRHFRAMTREVLNRRERKRSIIDTFEKAVEGIF